MDLKHHGTVRDYLEHQVSAREDIVRVVMLTGQDDIFPSHIPNRLVMAAEMQIWEEAATFTVTVDDFKVLSSPRSHLSACSS